MINSHDVQLVIWYWITELNKHQSCRILQRLTMTKINPRPHMPFSHPRPPEGGILKR